MIKYSHRAVGPATLRFGTRKPFLMLRIVLIALSLVGMYIGMTSAVSAQQSMAVSAARIVGRVVAHSTGKPVAGVTVQVRMSGVDTLLAATTTADNGEFDVRTPAGVIDIQLESIGYQPRTSSVTLSPGTVVDIQWELAARPVELEPIKVSVRSRWLQENGYYDRRKDGMKAFVVTRADIEHRNPQHITEMLDDAPGVNVMFMEAGQRAIRINRYTSDPGSKNKPRNYAMYQRGGLDERGCEPDMYIDGRLYRDDASGQSKVDDYDAVPVNAVEAMEVYVGNTPTAFRSNCGVILIWLRHN
jgi:Carboxypeptidase regulatory-like domain/TonB-dependent Receptor Plug Domain